MDGNFFCTTYNRLPGLVVIRENEIRSRAEIIHTECEG